MKTGQKKVITELQIKDFLEDHYAEPINEIAHVGEGWWSQAFTFTRSGTEYVVRFGAHNEDFLKDKIASDFAGADLPVPKVLEVGAAFGEYFAISERAYGTMFDHLSASEMKRAIPSILQTFDAIRRIDASNGSGYGMWDLALKAPHESWQSALLSISEDDAAKRGGGWSKKLANNPKVNDFYQQIKSEFTELASRMPNERYVIHNDVLNRNMMIQDDKVSAVIDWANAMYGDFLYDIAHICFWSPWYPAMNGIDWESEAKDYFEGKGIDIPLYHERVRCYLLHTGLDAIQWNLNIGNDNNLEWAIERLKVIRNS